MRKTKIVCTLGPATDNQGVLKELIKNGMDVARFNFSHGTHEDHFKRLQLLVAERKTEGKHVAAMIDTRGPEIRVKDFADSKVLLTEGQKFTLTTRDIEGTNEIVSITYPDLPGDIKVGTRILIDDGLIAMVCEELTDTDIICRVTNGGWISDKKGVNIPQVKLSMPYVSDQDREDIIFAAKQGFDILAASFVRSAGDILKIRRILEEINCVDMSIIAKIENLEGVENIDDIIQVSDGIMVARGDMGVEIPFEDVPVMQKMIIDKVYKAGKQVITATQMLDSMMKNPRPTRAEAADVANAIYDGTSAIMLSGETAAGKYPVEALKTMVRIAERTEKDINYAKRFFHVERKANPDVTDAISHATCTTAIDLNAKAIVTVSKSGRSARMVSRYRPPCDIIAGATHANVCRRLNLSWGVHPVLLDEENEVFELFNHAIDKATKVGFLELDDLVVMTAGVPLGISGTTNMIKVHVVGRNNG